MENDIITLGEQLGIYDNFKDILIIDDQNNIIGYTEYWDIYRDSKNKLCILSKYDYRTKIIEFIR
jgi:hypothetical protein